ncbi:MAG: hypothetical protein K2P81_14770 [Bacteriovoracaceae bacterium]|nr:hypothetical protein [Bacteriovoracaceae bacterium]
MVNTKEFIAWFILKAQNLGVTFNVTPLLKNNDLFHVSLFLQNIQAHGTSQDLEEAKLKAIVEFLERYNLALLYPKRESSGVACHFSEKLAQESAYQELIERDSFLWHWHHFIAPTFISSEKRDDLIIKTYALQARDKKTEVFLACVQGPSGLIFLGTASQDPKKAAYEAISNYYAWKINAVAPLALTEFVKQDVYTPMDHFRLSLHSQTQQKIKDWLQSNLIQKIDKKIKVALQKMNWSPQLQDHKLFMYQATSKDVLSLYVGLPTESFINPLPHPLN